MARERWPKARRSSGANQRALRSSWGVFFWATVVIACSSVGPDHRRKALLQLLSENSRNSVIWKTVWRRPISGVSDWTRRGLTMLPCQHDLFAAHVSSERVGDCKVTEPGWYARGGGEHGELGPFTSVAERERIVRDRKRLAQKA